MDHLTQIHIQTHIQTPKRSVMIARPRVVRRRALTIGAAVLTLAAPAMVAVVSAGASTPTYTLRVGVISNVTGTVGGLEGWGEKQGIWAKALKSAGVTSIQWQTFPNGPNLDAALAGGSLDLGVLGDTPAVTAKAAGASTRLINQDATGLDTWIFAKKNGPTTLAGLAGGTVAVPEGSYIYRALVGILAQHGLTNKVTVTNLVSVPEGVAALNSGSIDAFAEQPNNALVSGGFPVIAKATKGYPSLLGSSVTVISSGAAQAHPGLATAWNKARTAVTTNAKANPSAYYAWDAGPTGDSVALLKKVSPLSSYDSAPFTTSGTALLKSVNTFLLNQKITTTSVSIDAWKLRS
jgi:sulfonate transport system substrate-binding protein